MKRCYVCDQKFNGRAKRDYDEHVIQNAIGGGLIAKGVLCASCGAIPVASPAGEGIERPTVSRLRSPL